jgi:ribosome-associated heat shock protein Hsp15
MQTMLPPVPEETSALSGIRIDRWLWAARFFKTRTLAKVAVEAGHIQIEGQRAKPAKEVQIGHTLNVRRGNQEMTIMVVALASRRGPAKVAQTLYEETHESIEQREILTSRRRMERAGLRVPQTKPSKKDRRDLRKLRDLDASWQATK